ncbi:MAG TPA: glutaredoxin family protein [Candidatus Methanoperedenaceae archaeon]|nr:glutaredoxin family protein [Candidatus Methanoperedenaceae archaeon]
MKLKIYALSTCVHCKALKRFLNKNKVQYDYVDVDLLNGSEKDKVMKEVFRLTKSYRFPTIVVGDDVVVGFYEDRLREMLGLK